MAEPDDPRRSSTPDPDEGARDTTHAQALGHAIKVIRTSMNLGRRELAGRAGLSYSYLAEIENGTKQLSQAAQAEIARALGISVAELWTATEEWARALKSGAGAEEQTAAQTVAASAALLTPLKRMEEPSAPYDPRGARARQLRWFSDTAARRRLGLSRAELVQAMREPLGPKEDQPARSSRPSGAAGDEDLEAVIERLRRVLEGLPGEDRERVLDLAERLGAK